MEVTTAADRDDLPPSGPADRNGPAEPSSQGPASDNAPAASRETLVTSSSDSLPSMTPFDQTIPRPSRTASAQVTKGLALAYGSGSDSD